MNEFNIPVYLNTDFFIGNSIDHLNVEESKYVFYNRYINNVCGISIIKKVK